MNLTQLVGFKRLQQLQDSMAGITGLSCLVVDADGAPITRPSRPCPFCTLVQSTEPGATHCGCPAPDTHALRQGISVFSACRYSGFQTLWVPFIHEGQHIGSWVVYQLRTAQTPISEALLAQSAMELDLSASTLTAAAEMQRELSEALLEEYLRVFETLVRSLVQGDEPLLSRIEHTAGIVNKCMNEPETGMVLRDYTTGRVLLANDLFAEWAGERADDLIGRPGEELRGVDFATDLSACNADRMLDADGSPCEPMQWNDYSPRLGAWLRCTNQLVWWAGGKLAHLATFRDITNERRTQDELSRLAYYDRQMNLPNGFKLAEDLAPVWDSLAAAENYLICFDITALRKLNDAHGRKAGDAFLRTVVKWIGHQGFENSTVYRIEGDEFCIRLEKSCAEEAVAAATRIYNRFAELWSLTVNGQSISALCSISLSVLCLDLLSDNEEMLGAIQRTLNISRKEQKIVVYDEATDREIKDHVQVQLSLKKCVKQGMNGFAVHFQPIVEPTTGLWKGLEALCRWTSPDMGPISPMVFIREAEQLGLIGAIGEWVLEESVRQCKAWELDKLSDFFVSVNLSPVQILSSGVVNNTLDILRRHSWPGSKLSLEVTESTRLNFNDHTLGVIENLCRHGIMIALDDFGTGYSSFNNMKNLPVSFVKTDHTFIKGVEQDQYMQYFYRIITELAHKTNMRLVVEGVETAEQLDIMLKNGVDYIQGYYFGRPMPAQELGEKLSNFHFAKRPAMPTRLEVDGHSDQGREGYLITTGTFNVQTRCMQILLSNPSIDEAVGEVIEKVGLHFKVSRAYVFREVSAGVYTNTHEWCAKGVRPQRAAMQNVDIGTKSPSWLPLLAGNGLIVASDITHLPADISGPLSKQDIRSVLVVPIMQDGEIAGFMGLDDCAGYRHWASEEIVMLQNLALLLESGLRPVRCARPPQPAQALCSSALAGMPAEAFIATHGGTIVWASDKLRARLGTDPAGKQCFKVLPGCDARCENCRAKVLEEHPAEVLRREVQCGETRTLLYNSTVPWNGQPAMLELAVDITGYERREEAEEVLEAFRQTLAQDAAPSNKRKKQGD